MKIKCLMLEELFADHPKLLEALQAAFAGRTRGQFYFICTDEPYPKLQPSVSKPSVSGHSFVINNQELLKRFLHLLPHQQLFFLKRIRAALEEWSNDPTNWQDYNSTMAGDRLVMQIEIDWTAKKKRRIEITVYRDTYGPQISLI